jgi:hypothetical protein
LSSGFTGTNTSPCAAEERGDGIEALGQVDADARLLLEAERQESGGYLRDEPVEFAIRQRRRVL